MFLGSWSNSYFIEFPRDDPVHLLDSTGLYIDKILLDNLDLHKLYSSCYISFNGGFPKLRTQNSNIDMGHDCFLVILRRNKIWMVSSTPVRKHQMGIWF